MTDRPSIFPQFSVNAPMPAGVKPPKGSVMPADIAAAIDRYAIALSRAYDESGTVYAVAMARSALDAAIFKCLRGEV